MIKISKKTRLFILALFLLTITVTIITVSFIKKPSNTEQIVEEETSEEGTIAEEPQIEEQPEIIESKESPKLEDKSFPTSTNCTAPLGNLMLINPNFTVSTDWIAARKTQLISVSKTYGIKEGNSANGDNIMDAEAASHLNDLVKSYEQYNPGHTLETRSCFRQVGTKCGRLCAATGTSDHHTGLTCDLLDPQYGTALDTDYYENHPDWQWLRENSYKFGFIDRFPEAWAGGPMSMPANVDENGTTGLFETWHYRYVGIENATNIATGKYNNGAYDSLEHYLKQLGLVTDLKTGNCR